jgi:hypothetical protein
MKILLKFWNDDIDSETFGPYDNWLEVSKVIDQNRPKFTNIELQRIDLVCDFCSHPEVKWVFTVTPGVIGTAEVDVGGMDAHVDFHMDKDGLWGACETCKNYILARRWRDLTNRSAKHLARAMGIPFAMTVAICAQPHSYFADKWDGKPPKAEKSDAEILKELLGDG